MIIGIASNLSLNMLNIDSKDIPLPDVPRFPLISNLVNGFIERGHEVVLYCLAFKLKEPLVIQNGPLTICIARRQPQAGRRLFDLERTELINFMRQYPADIINAQWAYEYAWAALDSGLPTVVTLRDLPTKILLNQFDYFRIMRWIANFFVMRKVKHLIANSDYMRSSLPAKHRKNTVVTNNFYSKKLDKFVDEQIDKKHYIITVSHGFTKYKNINKALLAFALLRKQNPELQYFLVGADMEVNGPAHKYAQRHSLDAGVNFIGSTDFNVVVQLVMAAKVLLHPSREESFGNAVLEAMVLGTPVVGGNKSGNVPFLLNFGKTGVMCDIDSPESMANAVISILDNTPMANKLKNDAQQFAIDNFSEDKVIDKYLACYNKILSIKQPVETFIN